MRKLFKYKLLEKNQKSTQKSAVTDDEKDTVRYKSLVQVLIIDLLSAWYFVDFENNELLHSKMIPSQTRPIQVSSYN